MGSGPTVSPARAALGTVYGIKKYFPIPYIIFLFIFIVKVHGWIKKCASTLHIFSFNFGKTFDNHYSGTDILNKDTKNNRNFKIKKFNLKVGSLFFFGGEIIIKTPIISLFFW